MTWTVALKDMIRDCIKRFLGREAVFLAYFLLGSWIFSTFERTNKTKPASFMEYSAETVNRTRTISHSVMNNGSQVWNMSDEKFKMLIQSIIDSTAPQQVVVRERWTFRDGLVFSFELLTTIGYGSFPPTTQAGRLLCVFYALFGIPLCLLFLKSIGQVINRKVQKLITLIETKCLHNENPENIETKVVLVSILFMVLDVVLSASVGSLLGDKNRSVIDNVYALFITFSTVGFGDIVLVKSDTYDGSIVVTVLGLVLVSTTIDAMLVYLEKKAERRSHEAQMCCCWKRQILNSSSDEENRYEMGSYKGTRTGTGTDKLEMNAANNDDTKLNERTATERMKVNVDNEIGIYPSKETKKM